MSLKKWFFSGFTGIISAIVSCIIIMSKCNTYDGELVYDYLLISWGIKNVLYDLSGFIGFLIFLYVTFSTAKLLKE